MELLGAVVVGFVLGYGVRSLMSRYRRTRRSLKFCEMQIHSSTAPVESVKL
jgi:NhaP-type Na+/H+ or K+/H+ antiporter